ncbi:MAG: hypothetical protein EKK37_14760 [Sphingobacteriales bacterium]|nr:MAG: hypothetical protein EKK37_14760 [Sphingobacteriales bacterium]
MIQDIKDFWGWVQNDSGMRTLFMIITLLILVFLNYAWIKTFIVRKKNVAISGVLKNGVDTLIHQSESTSKHDTVTNDDSDKSKHKIMAKEKDSNKKKQGSNDVSGSTFNGPVQIGDHNIQNNNFGPQPRQISDESLSLFFANHKDKSISIRFNFINGPTDEMINLKNQIINVLKKHGYNNIEPQDYANTIMPYPSGVCQLQEVNNGVQFVISPL